jgi:hypothetical protein
MPRSKENDFPPKDGLLILLLLEILMKIHYIFLPGKIYFLDLWTLKFIFLFIINFKDLFILFYEKYSLINSAPLQTLSKWNSYIIQC